MITKELLDFIGVEKKNGKTDEQIKEVLVKNGWLASDVEEAFRHVKLAVDSIPPPVAPAPISQISTSGKEAVMPKNSHKGLLISIIVILVLLAGGASAYFFRDNLKTLPLIKNFFPQTDVAVVPADNQTIPVDNTTPIPLTDNQIVPVDNTPNQNNTAASSGPITVSGFVNRNEIAGKNLYALTIHGQSTVAVNGSFSIKVSGASPQLVALIDDAERSRGMGTFFPLDKNVTIDLDSTVLLIFLPLPSSADKNVTFAQILQYARTLECFAPARSFVKGKLLDVSYDFNDRSILKDEQHMTLVENCVTEIRAKTQ